MVRTRSLASATVVALMLFAWAPVGLGRPKHGQVSAAERKALVRHAQLWTKTDVGSMNIKAGPHRKDGFAPGQTVTCSYLDVRLGGNSPKFACALAPENRLKVRYGRTNGEVFASVAATRLLWALGFGADAVYPVHVVCRGCPPELAGDGASAKGGTRFDAAAIERKMPGEEIEAPGAGTGWAWSELDQIDEAAGGAPLAQRDAFKLLAVFLQHTDSKADQQRLVCRGASKKGDAADCAEPFMFVHDVGLTFGGANLFNRDAVGSVNLEQWRGAHVWKDASHCIGNLSASQTGTLADPIISEGGRRFLADLLTRLSDGQLRDLFTVARFTDRVLPGGKSEMTTVDQWVETFKKKREEITAAHCIG